MPDYVLKVENNYAWVLDAKAPNQNIKEGEHIEQVYSYATHPEIRSNYFALCNGVEFSLFKTTGTDTPILFFTLDQIEYYWENLSQFLSINSFQIGKSFQYYLTSPPTHLLSKKGVFKVKFYDLYKLFPIRF